ncbi:hypothetical protein MMC24_007854 [Lignoscripta atroalba]|nr:hypothetical protein [Lignoscripta atroalba]
MGIPNKPPITLLLPSPTRLFDWKMAGQSIELVTNGKSEFRKGFDVELALPAERTSQSVIQTEQTIYNLVVSVKAPQTVQALSVVVRRLTRDSTILFLQNGMGIIEEVNEKLFPDVETRPNYMLGVVTHGVYSERPFTAVHAGQGTAAIGLLPRYPSHSSEMTTLDRTSKEVFALSSRYLLRTITRTPVLAAVGFAPTDLFQLQLEKLAVNAIINPLTVMFDCLNGELLHNFAISRAMRLLLSEISLVIRSFPELQGVPNVSVRFSPQRLETLVVSIAAQTSLNYSSMLEDVRQGRMTEVDYITGYIVRRGERLGFKCVMNYMLLQMVKGKQQMMHRKEQKTLPFEERGKRS